MNEFEANLGRVKREEPYSESILRQEYQNPREEQYSPNPEPTKFKEAFILFFLIIGIITIFIMFGLYLSYVSNDKFKSINDQDVNLEPKIDVYSNSTTNNQYNITSPIVNYFNITIVNNNYINVTGGNQS